MWPSVGYGLCSNMAPKKDLDSSLKNPYWKLVPLGGVIRTTPEHVRQLDRGFYGIGLPQPTVECMVAQVQCLLMHYGCKSSLSHVLNVSINYLILELGVSNQPFQESYALYNGLVTTCWAKRLWEKVDSFGITVELQETALKLPRQRDKWLILEFVRLGYKGRQLVLLNLVWVYQQVIFLSEILCPAGKSLDRRYLHRHPEDEDWSCL